MNRPMRWGLLGAGKHAQESIAPAIHASPHAVLQAVAARDLDRARALEPKGGCYERYEQLLSDPAVDAVYVALANDAHVKWTLAAVDAGRPVLCEKPLALRAADVDRLIAAEQATNREIAEASWYRWHPRIRMIQALLHDGAIGEPQHMNAQFCCHVPQTGYRFDRDHGGGAVFDLGCYVVSAALWVFGGAPTVMRASWSVGETGVDLAASAHLTFARGAAELNVAFVEDAQALLIEGDHGRIEVQRDPFTSGGGAIQLEQTTGRHAIHCQAGDTYTTMIGEVSRAFNGGDGWRPPLQDSWLCAALVDAWRRAAESGLEIRVDNVQSNDRRLACAPQS